MRYQSMRMFDSYQAHHEHETRAPIRVNYAVSRPTMGRNVGAYWPHFPAAWHQYGTTAKGQMSFRHDIPPVSSEDTPRRDAATDHARKPKGRTTMPTIKIEGVPPYDGEYDLAMDFTNREFHTIKQISGIRAGELEEAMQKRDTDLIVALAVNALRRAGRNVSIEALWDAPTGKIVLDLTDLAGSEAATPPASKRASKPRASKPRAEQGA